MIRIAQPKDLQQIAKAHVNSWKTSYVGQIPQAYLDQLSIPKRAVSWAEVQANSSLKTLVAESAGEIVGFSSFGPSRDNDASLNVGELRAIYLIEENKGQGIGRMLWDETRASMKKLGYSEVTLWVLDTNKRARDFYEKIGFVWDQTQKEVEFGGQKVLELRYRLKLD